MKDLISIFALQIFCLILGSLIVLLVPIQHFLLKDIGFAFLIFALISFIIRFVKIEKDGYDFF